MCRQVLGPTQACIQCIPEIQWPQNEADQSETSSARVKNELSYTSTPPTGLHSKDKGTFTLTSLYGGIARNFGTWDK